MANSVCPPSIDEIKRSLPAFCRRRGIARVEVFGSVAMGKASTGSDLDLMVTFLPGVTPGLEFFGMQKELEGLLGCRVDLVTRRAVEQSDNPIRRRSVLKSAREIYAA